MPLPVTAAVVLVYFVSTFFPVTRSAGLAWSAFDAARFYRQQAAQIPSHVFAPQVDEFLRKKVIQPLRDAVIDEDPGDAHRFTQLANWYGELWKLPNPDQIARHEYRGRAVAAAKEAERLDPDGREGYWTEYGLYQRFAAGASPGERRALAAQSAEVLGKLARVDPTDVRVRYLLASMLFAAGQPAQGREQAREADRLDRLATRPERQLGPGQRRQVEHWLRQAPPAVRTGPLARPSRGGS
jgi:cytochrome c-type biogenesis protein CcmH/NrfG